MAFELPSEATSVQGQALPQRPQSEEEGAARSGRAAEAEAEAEAEAQTPKVNLRT